MGMSKSMLGKIRPGSAKVPPSEENMFYFNKWWDSGKVSRDNPFRQHSAAYWAYEGWQAAQENKE